MVAVAVSNPPGAKSAVHRHAASAFIYAYVLSGAIRSQVDDAPAKIYHAGEGFYEEPGAQHRVSENASANEPAFLDKDHCWHLPRTMAIGYCCCIAPPVLLFKRLGKKCVEPGSEDLILSPGLLWLIMPSCQPEQLLL
jgi:hypothetical protein